MPCTEEIGPSASQPQHLSPKLLEQQIHFRSQSKAAAHGLNDLIHKDRRSIAAGHDSEIMCRLIGEHVHVRSVGHVSDQQALDAMLDREPHAVDQCEVRQNYYFLRITFPPQAFSQGLDGAEATRWQTVNPVLAIPPLIDLDLPVVEDRQTGRF